MIVREMVDILQAEIVAGAAKMDNEVSSGYTSDLLSNVMGQAASGTAWITMQGHQNIIAVASLLGLSAVIIAGGVKPEKETIHKAEAEEIPLLTTVLSSFTAAGLLYDKGIRGV